VFNFHQRTGHGRTVALLAFGLVFTPALVISSRPVGNLFLALAVMCSAVCVILAWAPWNQSKPFSVDSFTMQEARTK